MRTLFAMLLLVTAAAAQEQLLTAKRIEVLYGSNCAQSTNHQENVKCAARLQRELMAVPLQRAIRLRLVGSHPDVILVFHASGEFESDTIKLSLLDAETNDELWSESRTLINAQDDVPKLIEHLLKAAKEAARITVPEDPALHHASN
jgi:hypothetical protein